MNQKRIIRKKLVSAVQCNRTSRLASPKTEDTSDIASGDYPPGSCQLRFNTLENSDFMVKSNGENALDLDTSKRGYTVSALLDLPQIPCSSLSPYNMR